jgi:hypothetical protein
VAVTLESIWDALSLLNAKLAKIQDTLDKIIEVNDAPSIGLRVLKLCNTTQGAQGQVVPGDMIMSGQTAADYFRDLGHATVVPLNDLPPWTHMALAKGTWWLIQMA